MKVVSFLEKDSIIDEKFNLMITFAWTCQRNHVLCNIWEWTIRGMHINIVWL